jgi:carboxypeptidase C (cathepsin A)
MSRFVPLPVALAIALSLAVPVGALAAESRPAAADARDKEVDKDVIKAPVEEQAKPQHASVTIAGKTVNYVATPGTLTIRNAKGEPTASMFYVAYTVPGEKARPVTFLFNGGPGSASLWLHMGSVGPVRVDTPTTGATGPAPFSIHPNDQSLLDKTDLVFLDAIGTGFSRPLGKSEGKEFFGVDPDINVFADGIVRYLTINNRWNSPKFVLGESYGTLRAAGLANALQERGANLNGVILLSSILNYGVRTPGYDTVYAGYLPSFAATAWYHNKLANRPAALEPFLAEVRAFALGPYLAALAKGDALPDAERDAIADKLAAYSGLSKTFILRAKLRVDLGRFRKELLREEGKTVGRYDSRFTGVDADDAGDNPETDPSEDAISGAYIAAVNQYLFSTLGYKTQLFYNLSARDKDFKWDWQHKAPGARGGWGPMPVANTAVDLAAAMRQNPHLKVLSLNGYYDMATPFFITEYDLAHMQLDPERRRNLSFAYFESGHMAYVRPEMRQKLRNDLVNFIDAAR